MQAQKVEVIRQNPSDRSSYEGLVGSITASITTLSYLHVGSGQQIAFKVIEDKVSGKTRFEEDYLPFASIGRFIAIPGSSVKGNIRSRLELSFKSKDGKVRSCFIRGSRLYGAPQVGKHGWRHYRIWEHAVKEERGMPCDHTAGAPVCLICNIFGTAGLKSLVEFSNFFGEDVTGEPQNLEYEMKLIAVPPNTSFKGSISFRNLKPEELGLILLGMGITDSKVGRPVLFGRLKYRSQVSGRTFGRIKYEVLEIRLSKFSQPLQMKGRILMEPGSYEKERLDEIVKTLTNHALHTYEGEFQIVKEVDVVEKLQ
ncbi:MAG: RAMP superfamily CRISPR-associated protein [Thermoproteota archaeon]